LTLPDFPVGFHPVAILAVLVTGIAKGAFGQGSGGICLTFALDQWFRFSERIAARFAPQRGRPGAVGGALRGAVSGFTSTLAHAGGPPFAIYMLGQRVDKTLFVGTLAVFLLIVNYTKLVPSYFLGQLNGGNLTTALLFSPLVPIGL
jgi:uncharacterized membrane protein YfcA